jgi:hypothetical protein
MVIVNEDGFIFGEGFLTPFRRYCFQVSTNLAIGDDAGSSPIIEYRKILDNLPREEVKSLLHGQAVLAIEKWLMREKNRIFIRFGSEEEIDRTTAIYLYGQTITGEKSVMDEFIDDCYNWIFN